MQSDVYPVSPEALDELTFLSNATFRLTELGPDEDIYKFIAEQIAELTSETVIVTSSYDPSSGCAVARAVAGSTEMIALGRSLVGEVLGMRFPIEESARARLSEGRIIRVHGGVYELAFPVMPPDLSREIEDRLGIRSVHAQAFARGGDFLGTVALISRAEALPRLKLIEALTRLVSVAVQRRRAEARLRESECRFRMLAENCQDIIYRLRVHPTPAFEYVNPAVTPLLGYALEEFYAFADRCFELVHPEDRVTLEAALKRAFWERLIVRWRRKDLTYVWTELSMTPIRNPEGEVVAVEGVARDIRAWKRFEQTLLEKDRRKNEFLAILSHELRNPLTPIRNSLLVLDRAPPGGEQANRARAMIERQVSHMSRLIDDLLDVTRISQGKITLHLERIELNSLVRSTMEDHRSLFSEAQVELTILPAPTEVWVSADRTRLGQTLRNLLQNAAKFTPPGGRTTVSVEADPEGWAILRVRDTGVGLSREILPRLFQPFVQADRTLERSKGGLGLGLALVKGLVDLHRGSVEADSAGPGKGAEFTVRLPREITAASEVSPALGPNVQRRPRRILVIEDNVDVADSLREVLELDEHTVELAQTGPEGVQKAETFKPDVVICDIGLPGMDGYSVARALRANPQLEPMHLVALSGYATPETIARSKEAGFDAHVAKPPTFEALSQVLSS